MMGRRGFRPLRAQRAQRARGTAQIQRGFLSQRTWGVVLVFCMLLTVPYWMAKKVSDKTKAEQQVASTKPTTAAANNAVGSSPEKDTSNSNIPSLAAATTTNPDRFGLSFGHGTLPSAANPTSGLMYSACAGAPLDMGNPDKNQCNPYQGDTSCRTALPVLCVLKDGSTAESAGLRNEAPSDNSAAIGFNFYAGWIGGTLGATAPVAGFVIGSLQQANARCAVELGAGWRMAEFHDAGGGWGLVGKRGQGLVNTNTRHWVAISDQKSHCWDPT
jgi:hypothetical protein